MSNDRQVEFKRIMNKSKIALNYGTAKVYMVDGKYHVLAEKDGIVEIGNTHDIAEASRLAASFDKEKSRAVNKA